MILDHKSTFRQRLLRTTVLIRVRPPGREWSAWHRMLDVVQRRIEAINMQRQIAALEALFKSGELEP